VSQDEQTPDARAGVPRSANRTLCASGTGDVA
jgi:hypothetical protein